MAKKTVRLVNKQGVAADRAIRSKLDKVIKSSERTNEKYVETACIFFQSQWKKNISTTLFFNKAKGGKKPLVDTGTYLNSISYNVSAQPGKIKGKVGSTIKNPPYPEFLEFGTSKMPPKPIARPTFQANKDDIKRIIKEGAKKGIKEGL